MYDVGILTFHCADNFGAMLQAYGLKTYLREHGVRADIIPYEPPFMTGRHWWIPYIPMWGVRSIVYYGLNGWVHNIRMGKNFFRRRANMKRFRTEYLTQKGQGKILFSKQFAGLLYQCYIVGSDQIWNPDITCGLRKIYFGIFPNKNKKKVIAYAASLGGAFLSKEYDKQFSELINSLDAVSVREKAAIPYIERFYNGKVQAVLDPVFLLSKRKWKSIEKVPDMAGYIFVYMTEKNDDLLQYVKELSAKKKKLIVSLKREEDIAGENIYIDDVAGPAEFLGYVHKADYVVTNSFHGIAFSIIYQKKFTVFQHSSVGERISNILKIHGLENRIYQRNIDTDIDCSIEWDRVEKCTEANIEISREFLMKQL